MAPVGRLSRAGHRDLDKLYAAMEAIQEEPVGRLSRAGHRDPRPARESRPTRETSQKRTMWNLPPPPGFQGLHPDKPVSFYQRHLPHWRQDGATYFVTFRLADSLPQSKLQELKFLKEDWERRHPPPRENAVWEELARQVSERVERWLDQGMGSCLLRHPSLAAWVTSALHHFNDDRYELDCYMVMPNHVHVLVRPLMAETYSLETILGSWKKCSSRRINRALQCAGDLWQEENYDRIIRDEEHLWRAIQYIGSNPDRAGLPRNSYPLWIRPQWVELGWRFESM